jgi:hypothetical protein
MGALLIRTQPALLGAEIEISRVDHAHDRVHVGVWDRVVNGHTVHTAVFPPLPAGRYTVWHPAGEAPREVNVVDGEVTELQL